MRILKIYLGGLIGVSNILELFYILLVQYTEGQQGVDYSHTKAQGHEDKGEGSNTGKLSCFVGSGLCKSQVELWIYINKVGSLYGFENLCED